MGFDIAEEERDTIKYAFQSCLPSCETATKIAVHTLIIILLLSSQVLGQVTMRKGPYLLYTGKNDEMRVLWQLTGTASCKVQWGTDASYSLGSAQTAENASDHRHSYRIENLIPENKYYYRVSVNGDEYNASFRTPPTPSGKNLKFMVYGDHRTNTAVHNDVAGAMVSTYTAGEEFQTIVLSVGDLVTDGENETHWDVELFDHALINVQEMLSNISLLPCMGNHEHTGILFGKYFPFPYVSGRYWSYDYGPAHFVVVDQIKVDYTAGSTQLVWIENDLASTDKPWKFVYFHKPGWSAGGHSNDDAVQNFIQPLCERYGVAIVFAGHNHYYARAKVNEAYHITTGGGGAGLDSPDPNYPNIIVASESHHYCKIEISGDMLFFTAEEPDGTILDTFTISVPSQVQPESPQAQPELVPASPVDDGGGGGCFFDQRR